MCKKTISVNWQGQIYDCDFNPTNLKGNKGPKTLSDLINKSFKFNYGVAVNEHCFACTAGAGSSCGELNLVSPKTIRAYSSNILRRFNKFKTIFFSSDFASLQYFIIFKFFSSSTPNTNQVMVCSIIANNSYLCPPSLSSNSCNKPI